jgi:hypothetical protein
MAYIVIVMAGQRLDQRERVVGPFAIEAEAFDWCADEQIDPEPPITDYPGERWGAVLWLDPP